MTSTLSETTFVVLDLETSGGSPKHGAAITEIGAVKVRGGDVIEEFQMLVNPGHALPEFITDLTGITDSMLANAPSVAMALPTFLEFIGHPSESVLVAHNAPFDIGFLKSAAANLEITWPDYSIIDTVRISRHVLTLEDVPNCSLSTLSEFFGTVTTPNHRALEDARATVDVLHAIFERLGTFDVTHLDQLEKLNRQRSPRLK